MLAFTRLRISFRATSQIYFPAHKAGNVLRGAFGIHLRKVCCTPNCTDARLCEKRNECVYAEAFEPQAARGEGPSGLRDWPRPFVFRAAHLSGKQLAPGSPFHFDVNLFDISGKLEKPFVQAFASAVTDGIGPGRGRAEVTQFTHHNESITLEAHQQAQTLRVRFITPTELKSDGRTATTPDFHTVFARARDRVSTLRILYGEGPLDIDYEALGQRAEKIRMTHCETSEVDVDRKSSRTDQTHGIGGFIGHADYAGDLTEFLPFLYAAQFTGVGRHTVWGNGEIAVDRVI